MTDAWLDAVFSGQFIESKIAQNIRFQAVFMMGPPGAGKSYVKGKKYLKHTGFRNIDPDEIKTTHPDYDPEAPFRVHEWSIQQAEKELKEMLPTGNPFVLDGTGYNHKKVERYIKMAKAAGYRTYLAYVWVPWQVSVLRNRDRHRFVPENVVLDKANKITQSYNILKRMVNKAQVIPNFEDRELRAAKKDLELYPAPQPGRPPRPGDPDYGLQKAASFN